MDDRIGGDGEPEAPGGKPSVHPLVQLVGGYSWRLLAFAGVVAVTAWVLAQVRVVIVALCIALVVARVVEPCAAQLRKRGLGHTPAVAVSFVGFLAVVAAVFGFVGWAVAGEFSDLGPTIEEGWNEIDKWIVEDTGIDVTYEDLEKGRSDLLDRAGSTLFSSGGSVSKTVALIAEVPTAIIIGLFVGFFGVKDQRILLGWFRKWFPADARSRLDDAANSAWATLGAFLRGAAILGAVESMIIGGAVALVGGSLVAAIMVLTFAAAFIPIVGATVAGVIAVLITLVSAGPFAALVVGIVALVVQQLDNDLLSPLIYGRLLRLHPIVIVVSVVIGGSLLGLLGAVLAVPLTAVVVNATAAVRGPLVE